MSKRRRLLRNLVVVLMLFGLSAGGVYAVLAHWNNSTKRLGATAKAGEGKRSSKPGQVRVKDKNKSKNVPPSVAQKKPEKIKEPVATPPATPLQVVEGAIKIHFGDEVRVTKVTLDKGVLTLEGAITKNRQIQDAREVAVSALEEAGFGPIAEDKVINLMRRPVKE
jgi:hypothetical protein